MSRSFDSKHACLWLCSFLFCMSLTSAAWAQSAGQLFEEGQAAYAGGDYGTAIFKFQKAYKEDNNPIFLYFTSLAYYKSGNFEKAIEYGERTAKENAAIDDPDRALPDKLVQRNDSRVKAMSNAVSFTNTSKAIAVKIDEKRPKGTGPTGRPGDPITPTNKGIGAIGWTGLALTITGGALMGASAVPNARLAALKNERGEVAQQDLDEANRHRTTGLVMLSSGAVVTLVGVGMFVYGLGSRGKSSTSLHLAPTTGGGYAGFSFEF